MYLASQVLSRLAFSTLNAGKISICFSRQKKKKVSTVPFQFSLFSIFILAPFLSIIVSPAFSL